MSVGRTERVNSLLRREIADSFYKVFASDGEMNLAKITVTQVDVAPNLRNATVLISILDEPQEVQGRWLRRIANKAKAFQALINRDMTLKYTPRLRFKLDGSIEKGDHVLDLLMHLDEENGETMPEDDDGAWN